LSYVVEVEGNVSNAAILRLNYFNNVTRKNYFRRAVTTQ
jgi:hypothetical protein